MHCVGILSDHLDETLALLRAHPWLVQQPLGALNCAQPILQFVRDGPVEAAKSLLPFAHLHHRLPQKVRRRGLLNDRDRVEHAMGALKQLGSTARHVDLIDGRREKRKEHAAKQLILLEQLVCVKALSVAQLTELHGLRDDRRVSRNFLGWILDIVGDSIDKKRYVVEKLLPRENSILAD